MKRNYPPTCKVCSVYKNMVLGSQIDCAISTNNRKRCPCIKCLVFCMCNSACDKFKKRRRETSKILDRGRL